MNTSNTITGEFNDILNDINHNIRNIQHIKLEPKKQISNEVAAINNLPLQ